MKKHENKFGVIMRQILHMERYQVSKQVTGPVIPADRSLSKPELQQTGFGCSLCDWTTKQTLYFRAAPEFGKHNNSTHSDTPSARMTFLYKRLK